MKNESVSIFPDEEVDKDDACVFMFASTAKTLLFLLVIA